MFDHSLNTLRSVILRSFAQLNGSTFHILAEGWHSIAVEVDEQLIFKFPKDENAERALLKEAALLAVIHPRITLPVPDLRIHPGPPVFSSHTKLQGTSLLADGYHKLSEHARNKLARDLACFYAEIHCLDMEMMAAAGAEPIVAWQTPDEVRRKAVPMLPDELRGWAERTISEFEGLPPDIHGVTYGFFDGHGWNMAFDEMQGVLNGIFDFADSGFGPLHQEFIYSNFISPDLTERIISAYEQGTGRALDRRRIAVLTGFHRLSELAEVAEDPKHVPMMIRHVAEWAATGAVE